MIKILGFIGVSFEVLFAALGGILGTIILIAVIIKTRKK
jgi:hypothetical protein